MKLVKILLISLLYVQFSLAQNADRKFESVSYNDISAFITVKVSDGSYTLQVYNTNMMETTFIPSGETKQKIRMP